MIKINKMLAKMMLSSLYFRWKKGCCVSKNSTKILLAFLLELLGKYPE